MLIKDCSILLTGATGFLGSEVFKNLRRAGANVLGTTRSGKHGNERLLETLDLEDKSAFDALGSERSYDAVVHFAAVLPGKDKDRNILFANQIMTYNLLEWALNNDVKYFIFASSCNIYGYSTQPCTELTIPSPPNPYAISKLACENLIKVFSSNNSLNFCNLRISAPYGPSLKTQTVVKRFIEQTAHKEIVNLYGSGKRQQDFIFEEDVALAVELALLHNAVGTFNISGNRSVSMYDLASTICDVFSVSPSSVIRFQGSDPQENYRGEYSTKLAERKFNYLPNVALDDGIRRTAKAWGLL